MEQTQRIEKINEDVFKITTPVPATEKVEEISVKELKRELEQCISDIGIIQSFINMKQNELTPLKEKRDVLKNKLKLARDAGMETNEPEPADMLKNVEFSPLREEEKMI